MATPKTVRNDLIPMKAGIVRVTPLDANSNPIYAEAYSTKRDFLTSTAITTTRTSETLANGNGSDKDFPTDEKYTLAVVTNTYDPKFHKLISGDLSEESPTPVLYDTTISVPPDTAYEVDLTDMPPVESDDGKFHLEIRDSYGNVFTQTDSTVESEYQYKYEDSTHKLTFHESAAGLNLSCVYYIAGTDGEAYKSNPVLQNPQFQIEIMGETRSADTGESIRYYAKMLRGVVSGDIPRVTTQKSISNAITYNFASAPVPQGMSAFYDSFTPIAEA